MSLFSYLTKNFALVLAVGVLSSGLTAQAQPPLTLVNFNGTNGSLPAAELTQATDGDYYGVTSVGGTNSPNCFSGCGTIFKVSANGAFTTLHFFDGSDGSNPNGGLLESSDGAFYGTTYANGTNNLGTVYRLETNGTLTTLISFNGANGGNPYGKLVFGADGSLYGTTSSGGPSNPNCPTGCGTVYKITPSGLLTTLGNFDYINGWLPLAGLAIGTDGNFYGTTYLGGFVGTGCQAGCGTVFKVTPTGSLAVVTNFNKNTGRNSQSGLTLGSDGKFYGLTASGGTNKFGTVFRVSTTGKIKVLTNFTGANGSSARGTMALGSDGNFYGTTTLGGASSSGTVFKVTPSGSLTTLVNFSGVNGSLPFASVIQGSDSKFYGTTANGGTFISSACQFGCGVVFQLQP